MLDRATQNLFQPDLPPDGLREPRAPVLEDAGIPAAPTQASIGRDRRAFTIPRPWRGAGSLIARARAARRKARHFPLPLLIVLAVSRLAVGGRSSPSAPNAARPKQEAPAAPATRLRRDVARAVPAKGLAPRRPSRQVYRRRQPCPDVTTPGSAPRTPPVSPAAPTTIAPPPGETRAPQPVVGSDGGGREFGFEH
jgi:hypothetical protein